MPERYENVLTRAAVLTGGVFPLAERLGVAAEDLLAWIGSNAAVPEEVLAKASAIVNAYEIDRTGTRLIRVGALRGPSAPSR